MQCSIAFLVITIVGGIAFLALLALLIIYILDLPVRSKREARGFDVVQKTEERDDN